MDISWHIMTYRHHVDFNKLNRYTVVPVCPPLLGGAFHRCGLIPMPGCRRAKAAPTSLEKETIRNHHKQRASRIQKMSKRCQKIKNRITIIKLWLVVSTPPKDISQSTWLFPICGKITSMFQTTNQDFVKQTEKNLRWRNRITSASRASILKRHQGA